MDSLEHKRIFAKCTKFLRTDILKLNILHESNIKGAMFLVDFVTSWAFLFDAWFKL